MKKIFLSAKNGHTAESGFARWHAYLFAYQKSFFESIFEGLARKNVGIFMAVWNCLRLLCIFLPFCGHLAYFSQFWYIAILFPVLVYCHTFPSFGTYIATRKIWQPRAEC
jgi:hypothetical protein